MNRLKVILAFLLCFASVSMAVEGGAKFPVPETVSPQMQKIINSPFNSVWQTEPKNKEEWITFINMLEEYDLKSAPALIKKLEAKVDEKLMAGVKVFIITPKNIAPSNKDRVLINLHGGGYITGNGYAGIGEAVLTATRLNISVIAVDYRMPPNYPYPAALDDAFKVYSEVIKNTDPKKVGVFGISAGGGLSLALVHRIAKEGVPMVGAVMAGTPWADLGKVGDTYYTNDKVDNILVSYDGWVDAAAKLYAGGKDLKDPMISPVYGDVSYFPPTLFVSGTRDLFLSNTVRMHLKLREAGRIADLIVFEAMSHGNYLKVNDMPETVLYFKELGKFFDTYLK